MFSIPDENLKSYICESKIQKNSDLLYRQFYFKKYNTYNILNNENN